MIEVTASYEGQEYKVSFSYDGPESLLYKACWESITAIIILATGVSQKSIQAQVFKTLQYKRL